MEIPDGESFARGKSASSPLFPIAPPVDAARTSYSVGAATSSGRVWGRIGLRVQN